MILNNSFRYWSEN